MNINLEDKTMLRLKTYSIDRKTDRDLEIPNFLAFLQEKKNTFESFLDVGAHYSANYYAHAIRQYAKIYHALDPSPDEAVKLIADTYFTGDFLKVNLEPYDFMLCLSTIEHVGMYPYIYPDRVTVRDIFFNKLLSLTKKYLWFSFPVGQPYEIAGQMSIIPPVQCDRWLDLIKRYKHEVGFFYSNGPQAGYPWESSTKEKCYSHQYVDSVGNQTICVMEVEK